MQLKKAEEYHVKTQRTKVGALSGAVVGGIAFGGIGLLAGTVPGFVGGGIGSIGGAISGMFFR